MNKITKFSLILSLLLMIACSSNKKLPDDLVRYSQDPYSYVDAMRGDSLIVSKINQAKTDSLSMVKYYSCWSDSLLTDTLTISKLQDYYRDKILSLKDFPGIGENKLYRDSTFFYEMQARTMLTSGFNKLKKGIMLQKAHIRVLPTLKPYFLDFEKAGEGYPFDYWQNSTIPMATPIFVYHEIDNWVLITCHLCSGWVEKDKIAYLNDDVIASIKLPNRVAITEDRTPIYSKTNEYLGSADIGTFFTFLFKDERHYKARFIKRNEWGFGELIVINIPLDKAKRMPIPLTQNNVAEIASKMINQTYGWGGMYFNRDCSQMTLDIFTPFGLILPRNGNHQASHGGDFIPINDLVINRYNEFIIKNAIPFASLVRIPGHIMLYLGEQSGKPIVMHNIWGLKTKSFWGKEGRYLIGKTVITGMELGQDIPQVDKKRLMLNRLSGVVNLFNELDKKH